MLIFVLAGAMLALGAVSDSRAQGKPASNNTVIGVPRDIDYLNNQGWTQVALTGPLGQPAFQVKNERIQSVLLVAFDLKNPVTVTYVDDGNNPKLLTSVSLGITAGKNQEGYVSALSFDEKDNTCRATVYHQGKNVDAWTKAPRMQSILETAFSQSVPIEYFDYKTTMEITRGKVHIELAK